MKVILRLKLKDDDLSDAEASRQISPRERQETAKKKEARLSLESPITVQTTNASPQSTPKPKRKKAVTCFESPAPPETTTASPRSSAKKRKKKITFHPHAYATPSDTDYAAEVERRSARLASKVPPEIEELLARPALPTEIDPTIPWKDLLARITRPADPCNFLARSSPPSEPRCDKVYCIYTPHTFEELRPIFYSPYLEPSELFEALSGHKMSSPCDLDEKDLNKDGLDEDDLDEDDWVVEDHDRRESKAQDQYIAFSNDLARNEILIARIFAQKGRKQWSRLEFGRAIWNYGQNYSGVHRLGMNRTDSKKVKKVLARVDSPDELEDDGVDDGADVDAQGDGAWQPQRSRKRRH